MLNNSGGPKLDATNHTQTHTHYSRNSKLVLQLLTHSLHHDYGDDNDHDDVQWRNLWCSQIYITPHFSLLHPKYMDGFFKHIFLVSFNTHKDMIKLSILHLVPHTRMIKQQSFYKKDRGWPKGKYLTMSPSKAVLLMMRVSCPETSRTGMMPKHQHSGTFEFGRVSACSKFSWHQWDVEHAPKAASILQI